MAAAGDSNFAQLSYARRDYAQSVLDEAWDPAQNKFVKQLDDRLVQRIVQQTRCNPERVRKFLKEEVPTNVYSQIETWYRTLGGKKPTNAALAAAVTKFGVGKKRIKRCLAELKKKGVTLSADDERAVFLAILTLTKEKGRLPSYTLERLA